MTAWSSKDDDGLQGGGLNRGAWAGDRFDIVGLLRLEAEVEGNWRDVTEEVEEYMPKILEAARRFRDESCC